VQIRATDGQLNCEAIWFIIPVKNASHNISSCSLDFQITSPEDDSTFVLTQDINFSSEINKTLGDYTCSWDSNINGALSPDCDFTTSSLQEGTHLITLTVEDDFSQETQEIVVDIKDNLGAEINSPSNGATFNYNETITLEGSAINSYGDVTCSWSSNHDDSLGEGCTLADVSLSENTHTITLTVEDAFETETDSITLDVGSLSASILSPLNNSEYEEGDLISFTSSVDYPYQGTYNCSWDSNIDGALSSNCSFTKSDLSLGAHVITLEVDDGKDIDTTTINLVINEPPCSGLPYIEYSGNYLCIHPFVNNGVGSCNNNYSCLMGRTIQWGCRGTLVSPSATSTTNGSLNTLRVVSWHDGWEYPWETGPNGENCNLYNHNSNDGTVAARVCSNLEFAGFDDWYLPAIDQLLEMYNQRNNVIKGDYLSEWEVYYNNWNIGHWSSTDGGTTKAQAINMNSGHITYLPGDFKSLKLLVRCVRDP
jgi:hypothetical protein